MLRRQERAEASRTSTNIIISDPPPVRTQLSAVPASPALAASSSSFVLARTLFLRALGFVYLVAFGVAWRQNRALIGDQGITPARHILDEAQARGRDRMERRQEWRAQQQSSNNNSRRLPLGLRLRRTVGAAIDRNPRLRRLREVLWDRSDRSGRPVTTLLWLARDRNKLDPVLDSVAQTGLAMSLMMMAKGAANVPLLLGIWLCHRSLMAVGGPWYGYGWEPQLSELGYHALFLVPLWSLQPIPLHSSTAVVPAAAVIWCVRWHLFRVMMGSGLIKFRSRDRKWRDLTTMNYFYETQPVPNPLTRYFHWMPAGWHKVEVLMNHFVEVVAPWLLIVPAGLLSVNLRRAGGLIQMAFQSALIASGNLSFLNWLTMVPAILCLDDALLVGRCRFLFSPLQRSEALAAAQASLWYTTGTTARQVVSYGFLALVLALSVPVVKNLLSKNQVMNRSYDPLRLINTYGAFGTVNEVREEFIISSAPSWDGPWKEYEFKVKPGDVRRAPRFLSPYHYRLDWQMWIAATCRTLDRSPWLYPFLIKLLQQDPAVLNELMAGDPWEAAAAAAAVNNNNSKRQNTFALSGIATAFTSPPRAKRTLPTGIANGSTKSIRDRALRQWKACRKKWKTSGDTDTRYTDSFHSWPPLDVCCSQSVP